MCYNYIKSKSGCLILEAIIDPPSPIRRHVKWKMARTKKIGEMTSEAAKEIAKKIVSFTGFLCPLWTSGSPDCCHWATKTPWSCACYWSRCDHQAILWIGSMNLPYFYLHGSQRTRAADSTNQGLAGGVDHRKSDSAADFQSQMQSQGLALPPEPEDGPSAARVSTKGSCVDPSVNDPDTSDLDKYGLYIEDNPPHLVALGRVYEVNVEEVKDADAPVPIPIDEVNLVGHTLNTFLAWATHLLKRLSEQGAVGPTKPANRSDHEVDDPLYLMTLTIPQLFLKSLLVMWDATMFGVFNQDFPLYIKHEDLFEIAHGGQCLNISVIQLWIMHLIETSMRAGNFDVYGFLEPQSTQRSGQSQFESESYMKNWMQNSKHDVYLGAYLNGAH
ncbi:hypothetical protein GmHk_12G034439 [Glycine max]|nr:hypothetical protein GmHk_12G034439 [Glycine max]KAH1220908.1 hypothetical protein GmHk_12G034439 [Glycine max]KAH1220909.1 hypothetical protein GmHk_12G034439 [Glycine max]